MGITVGDVRGDESLLQAGKEDGVDRRGGGHVVGFLGGAEGALEGDGEAVGSGDGVSFVWVDVDGRVALEGCCEEREGRGTHS